MNLRKKLVGSLLCMVLATSLGLSACGTKPANGGINTTTPAVSSPSNSETQPGSEPAKDTGKGKTLEISWFEGGTGREYIESAIDLYQSMYPDLKIVADIGPKNHEQLRPRFVAGNPPDVVFGNASFLDYFALIADDQLMSVNDLLESPAPDDESKKLKDIFVPGTLDRGSKDGQTYVLPGFVHYYGLWYDENTFSNNGWNVPDNYEEWLEVSEQIKQSGKMSPFIYQGMYPYYLLRTVFFPSVVQYGGKEAFDKIDGLEPGAWKQEAVLNAARDIKAYCDKYLLDGTLALNHTQAQMELINGRAAMITCGTFLESEMEGNWPDNFKLKYMFPPVNKAGKNDKYIWASSEFRAVSKNAQNPEMAKEFLKNMYRSDMRKIAAKAGGVYPIVGGVKGFEDVLPDSVVYANSIIGKEGAQVIFGGYEKWYKTLYKKAQDSLTALISGKYTVEQFADEIEKEAERIRQDSTIVKYKVK